MPGRCCVKQNADRIRVQFRYSRGHTVSGRQFGKAHPITLHRMTWAGRKMPGLTRDFSLDLQEPRHRSNDLLPRSRPTVVQMDGDKVSSPSSFRFSPSTRMRKVHSHKQTESAAPENKQRKTLCTAPDHCEHAVGQRAEACPGRRLIGRVQRKRGTTEDNRHRPRGCCWAGGFGRWDHG